jgi:hypothetical protein
MKLPWLTAAGPSRMVAPLVALALCATQLTFIFPGELISDSRDQLHQAITHQYLDWHPPIMAFVWSWLLRINGNPGLLLVLHQCLHWLGFGLIADGFFRVRMPGRAWLVLAAGAFPVFLFYDKEIVKDVGLGSGLVAGFGMLFWFLVQRKSIPWWAVLSSGICIVYGALIRTNAVFAIGPILLLYFARGREFGLAKIVGCSVLTALVVLPLSNWINHEVIGARRQDPLQSLQIFDLMGIAVRSGDIGVLGEGVPPMDKIAACYTSYWWDPYSPWGICQDMRYDVEFISPDMNKVTPHLAERSALWRRAILTHPGAYLAHRLSHFNSSIYFFVPSLSFRYSKSTELAPSGRRVITQSDIYFDYLRKNLLFWPVFWLALGVCALALLKHPAPPPPTFTCARALLCSGLFYSAAYLVVGVATETRYHYWSIMAIMLGIILGGSDIAHQMRTHPTRSRLAVALVLAVVCIGFAARIADVGLL